MTNPILPGFFPDPSVCMVDGLYYLANSSFEYFPALPLHVSDDFENWSSIGHAIDRPGQLDLSRAADSGGTYAPALRYHDGTFYLACTSVGSGEEFGSFYLTATDPAGDWSDPIFLPDARGFDPSLFFDGDVIWWVECRERETGRYWGDTEVWMRQLDLAAGALVGPEYIIWEPAMRGGVWAEGPHIHRRGEWFYLITAEGGTEMDHAVMVARSRLITGPYEGNPRNPILTHRHLGRGTTVRNVGHLDLVEGPDAQWRAVHLASRQTGDRVVIGRETYAADVIWEDGWPVINPGAGIVTDVRDVPLSIESSLPRLADFIVARGPQPTITEGGPGIVLDAARGNEIEPGVWRRLQHHTANVAVTVELLTDDAIACLALRQSDGFQLAIEYCGDSVRVVERRDGLNALLVELPCERRASVTLRAKLTHSGVAWLLDDVPVVSTSTDVLSTEVAGGFVGSVFGVRPAGPVGSRVLLTGWFYDGR